MFIWWKVLADQQQVILRQLLEEPSNQDDNSATIKAKYFYKSCVNISKCFWSPINSKSVWMNEH